MVAKVSLREEHPGHTTRAPPTQTQPAVRVGFELAIDGIIQFYVRLCQHDSDSESETSLKSDIRPSFIQTRAVKGTASQATTLRRCLARGRVRTCDQRLPNYSPTDSGGKLERALHAEKNLTTANGQQFANK